MSHLKDDQIKRLYYSIGDLATMLNTTSSCIRFWLNEFGIEIRKNRRGDRRFTPEEVALLTQINKLLTVDRYTLEGAKKVLNLREDLSNVGVPMRIYA